MSGKIEKAEDQAASNECSLTYPLCLLLEQRFPANRFWKLAVGIMAATMVIFSACLLAMAVTLNSYALALNDAKKELLAARSESESHILAATSAIITQLQHHKEISLENRGVQQEVRGLIAAYLRLQDEQRKQQKR